MVRTSKPNSLISQLEEEERTSLIVEFLQENPELLLQPELRASIFSIAQRIHQGPLPPPEDFKAYEAALPGACDRILRMSEAYQQHLFAINSERVEKDYKEARRGQVYAMILALAGLGLCAWTAWIKAPWQVSVSLGAAGVALLIAPFFKRNS